MHKRQNTKTVQFSHLSEDHKAQFLQFLLQNNICFQQGKENVTAKVSIKPEKIKQNKTSIISKLKHSNNKKQNIINKKSNKQNAHKTSVSLNKNQHAKTIDVRTKSKEILNQKHINTNKIFNEVKLKNNIMSQYKQKHKITTPIKKDKQKIDYFKFKNSSNNKIKQFTPKSNRTLQIKQHQSQNKLENVSQKRIQYKSSIPIKQEIYTEKISNSCEDLKKKKENFKYSHILTLPGVGRPVKWPINIVERIIQQIYDQVFVRNTQCLQSKNISSALKSISSQSFSKNIQNHFLKKFKGSKIANINLNNLLHSLSHHIDRQNCPIMLITFQDFLQNRLQHQDLLYYLFARNILKKQMKILQKLRQSTRTEGSYFIQPIKLRDINRFLKAIIGKDNQILSQYRELIQSIIVEDHIGVYNFLKMIVDDYHQKRIQNSIQQDDTMTQPLFQNQSIDQCTNQQLTFGQQNQQQNNQIVNFWHNQSYYIVKDDLYELIMQKMEKKARQLIDIFSSDLNKQRKQLKHLHILLLKKSQCLVKSVYEMNKIKWFRQLQIQQPSQQDIDLIQTIQIKLKNLRQNPSGKQIGQFCKNILTSKSLVHQLQKMLNEND